MVVLLATAPTATAATALEVADAAWPSSPCVGRIVVLWDDSLSDTNPEIEGTASGVTVGVPNNDPTTWTLRACEITLDTGSWAEMTVQERCELVVHEAGHLAMHAHSATGVMAAAIGYYPLCATPRARVERAIQQRLPRDAFVICGRWRAGAMTCNATSSVGLTLYRVRMRGETFTMQRVRASRWKWIR